MKTCHYTGDFRHLQELGFLQNVYKTYWFLPSRKIGSLNHYLFIDVKTREIEYTHEEDLRFLQGLYN